MQIIWIWKHHGAFKNTTELLEIRGVFRKTPLIYLLFLDPWCFENTTDPIFQRFEKPRFCFPRIHTRIPIRGNSPRISQHSSLELNIISMLCQKLQYRIRNLGPVLRTDPWIFFHPSTVSSPESKLWMEKIRPEKKIHRFFHPWIETSNAPLVFNFFRRPRTPLIFNSSVCLSVCHIFFSVWGN